MDCHKCSFSALLETGLAEGTEYGKSPCATCQMDSGAGKIMVQYDEAMAVPEQPASEPSDDRLPVAVLADAVHMLLTLPRDSLDVVRLRYSGLPYGQIACELGLASEGAAMTRMTRVLDANPVLVSLFPRKAKARQVRKERLRVRSRRAKRVSGGKGT